ncbi:beta-galactosidase-like [Ornithodoros turicata]|uniref:beta-galactosidase-like n=1 Tax=Ornithodoros turicata TaxID=34597 RepID=UPI00313A1D8D
MKSRTRTSRKVYQRGSLLILILVLCCAILQAKWPTGKSSPIELWRTGHVKESLFGSAPEDGADKVNKQVSQRLHKQQEDADSQQSKTSKKERNFTIDYQNNVFLKDGEPFRIIAGAIHYFRVPKPYWKDRLRKMKAAGVNAVETYVEWSGHEPQPGSYNFVGMYDIEDFIKTAQSLDLLVILRPGPYICAERENGGLPYWLLGKNAKRTLRRSLKPYIFAVDKWFGVLGPLIAPLLYHNGGPIIMVQIENEYGTSLAHDFSYMKHLVTVWRLHLGPHVPLFTTDGAEKEALNYGTVKGALATVDFKPGFDVQEAWQLAQEANHGKGPFVVGEFYTGWFDRWGDRHARIDNAVFVRTLEEILKRNGSVIFYMFHGGTNFGFSNGAHPPPQTTSYDYAAPLSEAGDPTDLYFDIVDVISRYGVGRPTDLPVPSAKLNYGSVKMSCGPSLISTMKHFRRINMLKSIKSVQPMGFEAMGQDYGYVMYTTTIPFTTNRTSKLSIPRFRDRAYVTYGSSTRVLEPQRDMPATISVSKGDTLTITVENAGRVNHGENIGGQKGILHHVTLDDKMLTHWVMEAVPITIDSQVHELIKFINNPEHNWEHNCTTPGFFSGRFTLREGEDTLDTFLDPTGWTKGVAFINGFNLGRYWSARGPQVTLYLPGCFLRPHPHENNILLLEMEGMKLVNMSVKLTDKHNIDWRPHPTSTTRSYGKESRGV